jgi:hypothetical protein
MAYTIIRSDGTTLTTIADGTINTSSSSIGLPGRNFSGYGQTLDTNMVRMVENFAANTPPSNPIRGQLWYDITGTGTLKVCPADGTTNSAAWYTLTTTSSGGNATFANLTVTGNVIANNASIAGDITGDTITVRLATVSDTLSADEAGITTATMGTAVTGLITTSANLTAAPGTAGSMYGKWTLYGNSSGNAMFVSTGNITFSPSSVNGIKCDNYMYANGVSFNPSGSYTNANVFDYMTGANAVTQFTGNIAPTKVTTTAIAGGGTVTGTWTLGTGARWQATFADLAERFEADAVYAPGTVVEIGGEKEITAVSSDLSEDVFGVVSNTAAYLMNQGAGNDETHPPIALSGRVTVNVTGVVKKGDRLVSAGKGLARAGNKSELTAFNVIGRSLSTKTDEGVGTVLAVVNIRV